VRMRHAMEGGIVECEMGVIWELSNRPSQSAPGS
jgi:hypothetical protein